MKNHDSSGRLHQSCAMIIKSTNHPSIMISLFHLRCRQHPRLWFLHVPVTLLMMSCWLPPLPTSSSLVPYELICRTCDYFSTPLTWNSVYFLLALFCSLLNFQYTAHSTTESWAAPVPPNPTVTVQIIMALTSQQVFLIEVTFKPTSYGSQLALINSWLLFLQLKLLFLVLKKFHKLIVKVFRRTYYAAG